MINTVIILITRFLQRGFTTNGAVHQMPAYGLMIPLVNNNTNTEEGRRFLTTNHYPFNLIKL